MQFITNRAVRLIPGGLHTDDIKAAIRQFNINRTMPEVKDSLSALAYSVAFDKSPAIQELRALAQSVDSLHKAEATAYQAALDLLACKGLMHCSSLIGFWWQRFAQSQSDSSPLLVELAHEWATVAPLLGVGVRSPIFAEKAHDPRFLNAPMMVAMAHIMGSYLRGDLDQYMADQFTMRLAYYGDLLDLDLPGGVVARIAEALS